MKRTSPQPGLLDLTDDCMTSKKQLLKAGSCCALMPCQPAPSHRRRSAAAPYAPTHAASCMQGAPLHWPPDATISSTGQPHPLGMACALVRDGCVGGQAARPTVHPADCRALALFRLSCHGAAIDKRRVVPVDLHARAVVHHAHALYRVFSVRANPCMHAARAAHLIAPALQQ